MMKKLRIQTDVSVNKSVSFASENKFLVIPSLDDMSEAEKDAIFMTPKEVKVLAEVFSKLREDVMKLAEESELLTFDEFLRLQHAVRFPAHALAAARARRRPSRRTRHPLL